MRREQCQIVTASTIINGIIQMMRDSECDIQINMRQKRLSRNFNMHYGSAHNDQQTHTNLKSLGSPAPKM